MTLDQNMAIEIYRQLVALNTTLQRLVDKTCEPLEQLTVAVKELREPIALDREERK